jgi:hypothetical protein
MGGGMVPDRGSETVKRKGSEPKMELVKKDSKINCSKISGL